MYISLSHPTKVLEGTVRPDGSKSISNRVLIIQALAKEKIPAKGMSVSDDTLLLGKLLTSESEVIDAANAGTALRFLLAYLCLKKREIVLTGSDRMKKRPIGPLVSALRDIGAKIEYLGEQGFPPVKIFPSLPGRYRHSLRIDGSMSSQFVSALMLIAPVLPQGLTIELSGKLASRPYVSMTAEVMRSFGAKVTIGDKHVQIEPGDYLPAEYTVEPDYSGVAFLLAMAALSHRSEVLIRDLPSESIQGDAIIGKWLRDFHVQLTPAQGGMLVTKGEGAFPYKPAYDCLDHPDLFPVMSALCGFAGVEAEFQGLDNLNIKESRRLQTMSEQLSKVSVDLLPLAGREHAWRISGRPEWPYPLQFDTYGDHRIAMAMSLAAITSEREVEIDDPGVVSKSYPGFWRDLEILGFSVKN